MGLAIHGADIAKTTDYYFVTNCGKRATKTRISAAIFAHFLLFSGPAWMQRIAYHVKWLHKLAHVDRAASAKFTKSLTGVRSGKEPRRQPRYFLYRFK